MSLQMFRSIFYLTSALWAAATTVAPAPDQCLGVPANPSRKKLRLNNPTLAKISKGGQTRSQSEASISRHGMSDSLAELEKKIRGAVDTLDALEEYTLPSERPDKQSLESNLDKLVQSISDMGGIRSNNISVPVRVMQQYIDEGRPPDAFAIDFHRHAQQLSDGVVLKQDGSGVLEVQMRKSDILLS